MQPKFRDQEDFKGARLVPRHPRVLYIGGLGRSGSTLLERALAQLPGACGAGELVYLWDRGIVENQRCGCGEPFAECVFWEGVGKAAFDGWDNVDIERVRYLLRSVDDVKHIRRLLRPRPGGKFDAELREYLNYYERLYDAILEVSGQDVVIDSSKITSLAYVLRQSHHLDVRVAHMLRDARGVSYSWTKKVPRPEVAGEVAYMPTFHPAYMSLLYDGHHALLELLQFLGVPMTRVRYEDFVDDPLGTVECVASFAGLSVSGVNLQGDSDTSLRLDTVHTVSGNPSRFKTGSVEVRRDEVWRTQMAPCQRRLVQAVAFPAQLYYGYTTAGLRKPARSRRMVP